MTANRPLATAATDAWAVAHGLTSSRASPAPSYTIPAPPDVFSTPNE